METVSLVRYRESSNPYAYLDGVVCAGTRSQPDLQYPGAQYQFATVATTLGLEMLKSGDRAPFLSAVLAYLTEQVSLNVSVVPGPAGDAFVVNLTSSLPGSLLAYVPPASLESTFSISFGDGNATHPTAVAALGSSMMVSQVETTHCFAARGTYNVTVQARSAFGAVAVWAGSIEASPCASDNGGGGFSDACNLQSPLAGLLSALL
jgi:hypothetical protein